MMIHFEQQASRITAVRSVDGITSMNIYIITQSNGIGKRASSMAIVEFSTCFLRRTLMFEMRTIESEDCSWSHFEQMFVHAMNYLAIPEMKNTNVQAAHTVFGVYSSATLPDPSFYEGLSQQSRSGIFFITITWKWITSLNPASDAVAATKWKVHSTYTASGNAPGVA
ncbi:hypothetical protein T10_7909 [Trichinella papuae]|uniref:Uncharacterized protein n=1 Tax=Trichinella papuae TaxID=268474 RepID=A0A0V1MG35_9BILA|nr:hypothetical protein T10_7909 [Trichinella papuae]